MEENDEDCNDRRQWQLGIDIIGCTLQPFAEIHLLLSYYTKSPSKLYKGLLVNKCCCTISKSASEH